MDPETSEARVRPAYLKTLLVLACFFAVSAVWPASRLHFPSQLPPLFLRWQPGVGPLIVWPIAIIAVGVWLIPRLKAMRPAPMLAILVILSFALSVGIAAESGIVKRWYRGGHASVSRIVGAPLVRFDQYFMNVQTVESMGPFEYAKEFPSLDARGSDVLTLHTGTHPPGAAISLWVLWRLVGRSASGTAFLETLVGVSTLVATYLIALEMRGKDAARRAAILFAFCPGVLVYSTTSTDAIFMAVVGWATVALVRAHRSMGWAVTTGVLCFAATFVTWGALLLSLFVGVGLLIYHCKASAESKRAALHGAAAAIGSFLFLLLVCRLLGIDLIADFRVNSWKVVSNVSFDRSHLYWAFGNLVAFLVTLGIANTAILVARTRQALAERALCFESILWGALILTSVSGSFRGETDHNWLFFIPLALAMSGGQEVEERLPAAAGGGQALLTEVLFYTAW